MGKSNRHSWIDWAKAICIILMVSCHAGQKGLVLDTTYQFHMPAFFIISGILFRPKGIINELKYLGVPLLLYGGVNIIFKIITNLENVDNVSSIANLYSLSQTIILESLKNLLFSSSVSWFQGAWFVVTLLLIRMLMNIRLIYRFKIALAFLCIVWSSADTFLFLPDCITSFKPYYVISCIPFFITGMLLKEKNINITQGTFEIKCVLALVFLVLTFVQGRVDLAGFKYGVNYMILFINALLGSYLLFNFCFILPTRKYIEKISTGTFLILGLHGIMYSYVNKALQMLSINNPYSPLLTGLIICVFLLPIIIFLENFSPIILGKAR